MSCFDFDLQLFADEAGGDAGAAPTAESAQPAEGGTPPSGDPAGTPPAGGNGTILGGQQNPQGGSPPAGVPDAYDFKNIVPEGMEYEIASVQKQWGDEARTQLGGQFDATVAKAAAGRDALAAKVPGLVDMLNETGAGNRVEMIRLLAAVSEVLGEDGGLRDGAGGAEKSIYPNTNFGLYN